MVEVVDHPQEFVVGLESEVGVLADLDLAVELVAVVVFASETLVGQALLANSRIADLAVEWELVERLCLEFQWSRGS